VPKALAIDDDDIRSARSRRRKAEPPREPRRNRWLSLALASPKDTVAIAVASAAVIAIAVNAVFLQAGRHPSPMFAPAVKPVASAPAATAHAASSSTPSMPAPTTVASVPQSNPLPRPRPAEAQSAPPVAAKPAPARSADPLAGLINASQRVAAVQRALTDYGYGQIRPTGTIGPETQAAIQRFERERKMPITGQMSDRLVRELGLATGRTIE